MERAKCAGDVIYWMNNYAWTYDPRLVGTPSGPWIRFLPWPKQCDLILKVEEFIDAREQFAVRKSRDQGATCLFAAIALHKWLFKAGFKTTFGSRLEKLVDEKDNPDTIFQKIRYMRSKLPDWMQPEGFAANKHDLSNRMINPANGATITGEGGDNLGRGGRSTLFVADEAAQISNPSSAEAAISGNTDCIAWVSTANLPDDWFEMKCRALPPDHVLVLYWRDDPRKDDEWGRKKRASLSDDALWQSEYEINPYSRVEDIVIPALWVQSAQALYRKFADQLKPNPAIGVAGGDVGGGKAKSTLVIRCGHIVLKSNSRGDPDTTDTAMWMIGLCNENKIPRLMFDMLGIGAGVASTLAKSAAFPGVKRYGVNVGLPPTSAKWPDGRRSNEMFRSQGGLKAELWWIARNAFKRSHELWLFLNGDKTGVQHRIEDCILLGDDPQLTQELSQPKWDKDEKGLIFLESKKDMKKRSVKSPDFADALVLTFAEPKMIPEWMDTPAPPPAFSIYGR